MYHDRYHVLSQEVFPEAKVSSEETNESRVKIIATKQNLEIANVAQRDLYGKYGERSLSSDEKTVGDRWDRAQRGWTHSAKAGKSTHRASARMERGREDAFPIGDVLEHESLHSLPEQNKYSTHHRGEPFPDGRILLTSS
jgi:hypothetical protein